MNRMYSLVAGLLMLVACSDNTGPNEPSGPNCSGMINVGAVVGVVLNKSSVTLENNPFSTLPPHQILLGAEVWRDWTSSPGEQFYCVDTGASVTWSTTNSWVAQVTLPQPLITGVTGSHVGTAKILAVSSNGKADTLNVTVQ
jgi:hypothetical protein